MSLACPLCAGRCALDMTAFPGCFLHAACRSCFGLMAEAYGCEQLAACPLCRSAAVPSAPPLESLDPPTAADDRVSSRCDEEQPFPGEREQTSVETQRKILADEISLCHHNIRWTALWDIMAPRELTQPAYGAASSSEGAWKQKGSKSPPANQKRTWRLHFADLRPRELCSRVHCGRPLNDDGRFRNGLCPQCWKLAADAKAYLLHREKSNVLPQMR